MQKFKWQIEDLRVRSHFHFAIFRNRERLESLQNRKKVKDGKRDRWQPQSDILKLKPSRILPEHFKDKYRLQFSPVVYA